LSAEQAAAYLSLSTSTMAKMRCLGGGPEYLKFGRSVRYDLAALDEWSSARRARNTSDAGLLPPRLTTPTINLPRGAADRTLSPPKRKLASSEP
jgi:predicted DNA-binding transcriptional regulator AlpA